jgi:hypothetical protein
VWIASQMCAKKSILPGGLCGFHPSGALPRNMVRELTLPQCVASTDTIPRDLAPPRKKSAVPSAITVGPARCIVLSDDLVAIFQHWRQWQRRGPRGASPAQETEPIISRRFWAVPSIVVT